MIEVTLAGLENNHYQVKIMQVNSYLAESNILVVPYNIYVVDQY
jgi:hypothetical protein